MTLLRWLLRGGCYFSHGEMLFARDSTGKAMWECSDCGTLIRRTVGAGKKRTIQRVNYKSRVMPFRKRA